MSECDDPSICRGGCCRKFLGQQFCEMESNCVDHPTWIIVLVPVLLGIAAIVLIVIALVRLNNRKTIDLYEHIKMVTERNSKESEKNVFLNGNAGTERKLVRDG